MSSPEISQMVMDNLTVQFDELNPAEITRQILRLQEKLQKLTLKIARSSGGSRGVKIFIRAISLRRNEIIWTLLDLDSLVVSP